MSVKIKRWKDNVEDNFFENSVFRKSCRLCLEKELNIMVNPLVVKHFVFGEIMSRTCIFQTFPLLLLSDSLAYLAQAGKHV